MEEIVSGIEKSPEGSGYGMCGERAGSVDADIGIAGGKGED